MVDSAQRGAPQFFVTTKTRGGGEKERDAAGALVEASAHGPREAPRLTVNKGALPVSPQRAFGNRKTKRGNGVWRARS